MKISILKKQLENENLTSEEIIKIRENVKLLRSIKRLEITESNSKEKSDNKIIPFLSIVLPALLTCVTILVTVYQFNKNSEFQISTDNENKWREFLKQMEDKKAMGGNLTIPATLVSYMKTKEHSTEARNIAINLLPFITDEDIFNLLFEEVENKTDNGNYNDLISISKGLFKTFQRHTLKLKTQNELLGKAPLNIDLRAFKEEKRYDSLYQIEMDNELKVVSKALIHYFRTQNSKLSGKIKLDGVSFFNDDLSNLNMSNATLNKTYIQSCSVENVDFSNVNEFDESRWDHTQWWKCKKISPKLLDYLMRNFPYNDKLEYFGKLDTSLYKIIISKKNVTNKTEP